MACTSVDKIRLKMGLKIVIKHAFQNVIGQL